MIDLLGYAGGAFLMISFLPQLAKSLRSQSMMDLSWGMLVSTALSGAFYEAYALLLGLKPVVIMNGFFVSSVLCAMVLKWRLDHKLPVSRRDYPQEIS